MPFWPMTTEDTEQSACHHRTARGRIRRQALMNAARELLAIRAAADITIPAISEIAGIPPSSAYHFFSDVRSLYRELAIALLKEMPATIISAEPVDWRDLVSSFLVSAVEFFNSNTAARKLLLDSDAALPDIRNEACRDDWRIGYDLFQLLRKHFHLPRIDQPEMKCYVAVRLADSLFSFSAIHYDCITPEFQSEAIRAATSYLGNYIPPVLERRTDRDGDATL